MTKSMTGFGRSNWEEKGRNFTIEIKSVNHRYFDLNIKMPRNLVFLEDKIRKSVSKKLVRGKIDLYISQNRYEAQDGIMKFNSVLGDSYVKCLKEIGKRYNLRDDISISLIARYPDVITLEQVEEGEDELWKGVSQTLEEALDMLVDMRLKEGARLQEDILKRCKHIEKLVGTIESKADTVVEEYRKKLNDRLKELIKNKIIDENRIAAEIAIYADKACIDEEIVRLKSHLVQMEDTLSLEEPIGRKMDFIVQEMNREVNTIASKTNNLDITNVSLNIKNEIEKVREQIQNIE